MKKFLLKFLCFALIQISALAFCVWFAGMPKSDGFFASIGRKETRFAEAGRPRVVFVGGSNLLFGIESGRIEAQTPYRPVNLGLHAGLGFETYLNQVEQLYAREGNAPGDLVVLCLEYHFYQQNRGPLPPVMLDQLLQFPAAGAYFPPVYWRKIVDNVYLLFGNRVRTAVEYFKHPERRSYENSYLAGGFNSYGDVDPSHRQGNNSRGFFSITVSDHSMREVVDRLNAFEEELAKYGVAVTIFHPSVADYVYTEEGRDLDRIDAFIRKHSDIPVLNEPGDAVLPAEDFFDTVYHLNAVGSPIRTEKTITALNDYWQREGKARFESGELPE